MTGRNMVDESKEKKERIVHSQVLKIREEDSHLGEDVIVEILSGKDYNYKVMIRSMVMDYHVHDHRITTTSYYDDDDDSNINKQAGEEVVTTTTRAMLPCSPLSRKTSVN